MSEHADLQALFTLVATSVAGPIVAARIALPTPVVLLLAGVLIGPSGLGLLTEGPAVAFLSQLGFLVLMFMAGMEIDFEALRRAGGRALVRPALAVTGFFAVAVGGVLVFGLSAFDALVASATSVGMPLAVLQETRRARTPLGREVMLVASLGEFVCIIVVVGFELVAHGRENGVGWPLVVQVGKVCGLFVLSAVAIRWARAVAWWYPRPFHRMVDRNDVAELGVRAGLLLMLGFVLLAAALGVEAILGAFIAGALVAFVLREKHALEAKIAAIGHGLFIPIFFVIVGLRFEPGLVDAAAVRQAAVLVMLAGLIKVVPTLIFGGRGLTTWERASEGVLLSAPLTLVVAVAAVGAKLGWTTPAQNAAYLLVAMVLSVLYPTVFRLMVRRLPGGEG